MPNVPLHPALVHVPLGLAFVLPFVAVALAIVAWRGVAPRGAWVILVALQAVLVLGGAAALRTGQGEERRVKAIVGEQALDQHEEAAEAFLWAAGAVLVVSVLGLALPRRAGRAAAVATAAGALLVAGLGYRAGHAGGELVYARGAAAAYVPATAPLTAGAGGAQHRRAHRD